LELILLCSSCLQFLVFWPFKRPKRRRFIIDNIKKNDRFSPGFDRVERVPGQFPSGFLPPPGPVSSPGRPGPGSTRRASPGFKTLIKTKHFLDLVLDWLSTLGFYVDQDLFLITSNWTRVRDDNIENIQKAY
jgi:hypothetical protein